MSEFARAGDEVVGAKDPARTVFLVIRDPIDGFLVCAPSAAYFARDAATITLLDIGKVEVVRRARISEVEARRAWRRMPEGHKEHLRRLAGDYAGVDGSSAPREAF